MAVVGQAGQFTHRRRSEIRSVRKAEGKPFDRRPVDGELGIGSAAEVAVLVVTPRGFEIQLLDSGKLVVLTDNRGIDLDETGPNMAHNRIVYDRYQQGRLAGAVNGAEIEIAGGVSETDGTLYISAGQIKERSVEFGAFSLIQNFSSNLRMPVI
jgi:hypothetical protein